MAKLWNLTNMHITTYVLILARIVRGSNSSFALSSAAFVESSALVRICTRTMSSSMVAKFYFSSIIRVTIQLTHRPEQRERFAFPPKRNGNDSSVIYVS